jgi:hypothetical protein
MLVRVLMRAALGALLALVVGVLVGFPVLVTAFAGVAGVGSVGPGVGLRVGVLVGALVGWRVGPAVLGALGALGALVVALVVALGALVLVGGPEGAIVVSQLPHGCTNSPCKTPTPQMLMSGKNSQQSDVSPSTPQAWLVNFLRLPHPERGSSMDASG